MILGINITDTDKIMIEHNKDELLNLLNMSETKYEIMFDKVNKDGDNETILSIEDGNIEITILNSNVNYIKSISIPSTLITRLDDNTCTISCIHDVIDKLADRLCVDRSELIMENINSETMNMVFLIKDKNTNNKYHIHVLMDTNNNVYMHSIRKL